MTTLLFFPASFVVGRSPSIPSSISTLSSRLASNRGGHCSCGFSPALLFRRHRNFSFLLLLLRLDLSAYDFPSLSFPLLAQNSRADGHWREARADALGGGPMRGWGTVIGLTVFRPPFLFRLSFLCLSSFFFVFFFLIGGLAVGALLCRPSLRRPLFLRRSAFENSKLHRLQRDGKMRQSKRLNR